MHRTNPVGDRGGGSGRPFGASTATEGRLRGRTRVSARAAIAVFVDDVQAPWLKFLSRGFRHVFAAVEEGSSWMICDPLKDRIELRLFDLPPGGDLADIFAEQGHRVLVGRAVANRSRHKFALAPLTCVAVVKRLLGVRAARVLTPRQLYHHLLHAHPEPFVRHNAPSIESPKGASAWRGSGLAPRPQLGAVIARERVRI